jgi:signal transduction histidine kinase
LLIRMADNISYALENFDREAERRKAEEKLRELNETLERRVEEEVVKNRKKDLLLIQQSRLASLGEMVHNISHHWRQPLTALGLAVQNIQLDYRDNLLSAEELEKYVASALKSIENMTRTIDDFRDFFRPSKDRRSFLAGDEVEKAIGLVGQALARDSIEIVLKVSAEACCAFGHPSEFAQVVLYVLTNAREAIGDKKTARKILIKVEKSANAILVSISNTGGNIPEDVLRKVFDPYFSTKESGAGIGLYLSKMIMQNMGGDIAIKNVEDGAEVLITLPLAGELS